MTPEQQRQLTKLKTQIGWYQDQDLSSFRCQAAVRIYVNRQPGGNWVQCSKNKRPGKRTCWHHRKLEEEL